jgi:hypothetical protein
MPKKRKATKKLKNKSFQGSSSQSVVSLADQTTVTGHIICPRQVHSKMLWQQINVNLSMAVPGVPYAYLAFGINSIYDPYYTLGGGSCTGFAEMMALYNKYIVSNAVVTMRVRNNSAANAGNDIIAYILEIPSDQVSSSAQPVDENILEVRNATTKIVPYATTGQFSVLRRSVNIVALEGLPSLIADYSGLSGNINSSPSRLPLVLAGVLRPIGSATGCLAEAIFTIEFTVCFYQPRVFSAT